MYPKLSKYKKFIAYFLVSILVVEMIPVVTLAVTLNLQVGTSLGDTTMAGTANDAGRNVTNNAVISTTGLMSPGSHNNNDEWTAGLRFTSVTVPQGTTITSATLTLTL